MNEEKEKCEGCEKDITSKEAYHKNGLCEECDDKEHTSVRYSYKAHETISVPDVILDKADEKKDDEIITDWIAKWINDVEDIEICDIG